MVLAIHIENLGETKYYLIYYGNFIFRFFGHEDWHDWRQLIDVVNVTSQQGFGDDKPSRVESLHQS